MRANIRRLLRRHPEAVIVVVLSFLVAIPLLRAFGRMVRGNPVLFTDYAIIATRAQDLWHGHVHPASGAGVRRMRRVGDRARMGIADPHRLG